MGRPPFLHGGLPKSRSAAGLRHLMLSTVRKVLQDCLAASRLCGGSHPAEYSWLYLVPCPPE